MARSKGGGSPRGASEKVMLAQIQVEHLRARAWLVLAVGAAGALMLLASWPVADTIAGKDTVFNVNVAFTLSAALTISTAGGFGWGYRQKKKADHGEDRIRDLSADVKELQERLRSHGLSDAVARPTT